MKNRFFKLFISFVLLLLPIFFIYLFMTQNILATLRSEIDSTAQMQLNEINSQFSLRFKSYDDTSVQISTTPELLRYKMTQNEINAYKGIEVLKDVKSYDAAVYDLFMHYGNGKIYSANGLSRTSVYFARTLGCDDESVARATTILEEGVDGLYLLRKNENPYFLLYHYPVRWNTDDVVVSVNFIMQVSTIRDMLISLLKTCDTYITVTFPSGEEAAFRGNAQTGLNRANDKPRDIGEYACCSVTSTETGLVLSVYYESSVLYREINNRQLISYLIIALLLIVSVFMSFMFSRHYHNPIKRLAAQIANRRACGGDQAGNRWSKTDELDYLKRIFDQILDESERMARGLSQYKVMLRPQTALLLFHGLLKEPAFIEQMLALSDYEFHEDYYVILVILALDPNVPMHAVLKHFEEDLLSPVSISNQKMYAILAGVPNLDYTYANRKKIAEQVREICAGGPVLIAFSQIYKNIAMISHAYREAMGGMENLLTRYGEDTSYFEKLSADASVTETPEEEMAQLENALLRRNEIDAMNSLGQLLLKIEYGHFSSEMKRYLRYSILQKLTYAIKSNPTGSSDSLLTEAMHVNPTVEDKFSDTVGSLIQRLCFTQEKEDEIKNVISYIHTNYSKYDLSLDEVAEYAGLSKSYLSKLFKTKTGKRYIDYLSELRLEEARRLLTHTQLTMQEIVRKVGYYDVPSFRKKFKAVYGINAYQYRKQNFEHG